MDPRAQAGAPHELAEKNRRYNDIEEAGGREPFYLVVEEGDHHFEARTAQHSQCGLTLR